MKLTNRHNLPEPFVVAFGSDDYERGSADYTTTELVRPVRISALSRLHRDELEEDVSERVWAFQGQTKHIVLERIARTNPERYLVEQRFEAVLPGGRKISGKIDLFDQETQILYDWKEQSVWKFIVGDTIDWEQQANINLFLMRMNDIVVKQLLNVTWLRDWKKRLARTTKRDDYPKCAIHVIPLPMWSVAEAQDFILKRITAYESSPIDDPPLCTPQERWQRPQEYALMKKGVKRAYRLYATEDQAQAAMDWLIKGAKPGEKFYIEERPKEPVRCLDFCPVQQFCDFGRKAVEEWKSHE